MRIGSLFSGIGGLELGLEWAGLGHTVWQVEQSKFCRDVLARHWPSAERFEDVRTVGAAELVPVDLICGGFPCQDVSSAGKGAGLAGERSGLWFEFARIIEELGPEWVVVENVASGAKRWVDDVRSHLGQLGYETLPVPLSAAAVGAPHLRRRIFLVCHFGGFQPILAHSRCPSRRQGNTERHGAEREHLVRSQDGTEGTEEPTRDGTGRAIANAERNALHDGLARDSTDTDEPRLEGPGQRGREARSGDAAKRDSQAPADANGRRLESERQQTQGGQQGACGSLADRRGDPWTRAAPARGQEAEFRPPVSPVRGVDDGLSPRLAREQLRALGNAVVPQCAEVIGWMIREIIEGAQ